MLELGKLAAWLLSPLTIALLLAMLAWLLRRRLAVARALAVAAFAVLWLGSTPIVAYWLALPLESRYAAVPVEAAPNADAILVLGGAVVPAWSPERPNMALGPAADRVWQAAALYRAGKAPWLIVAAGNIDSREGLQIEADAIAHMLVVLGVPPERTLLEGRSRTTRENAGYARERVEKVGARKVLLVTSAQHLPRAMATFGKAWTGSGIVLLPFPADVGGPPDFYSPWVWIPSADALRFVTRVLKEYAGMVALSIM